MDKFKAQAPKKTMKGRNLGGLMAEVAVYKGETIIAAGTIKECAAKLGIQPETIYFYLMPSYKRRVANRKKSSGNIREVVLTPGRSRKFRV